LFQGDFKVKANKKKQEWQVEQNKQEDLTCCHENNYLLRGT